MSRRTRALRLLAAGCCVAAATGAPALAAWHFAVPDGWIDLSPGKPVPAEVPEVVATAAQSGPYVAYGIDMKGAKDGFAENLNAIVQQVPTVVSQESLDQYVAAFPAQARREVPGAKVTVREQGLKPIAGVPSLRLVVDLESPMVTMRTLHYVIPGGSESAALTYSATPETFDQYLPIFEAAAQKTEGAAEAPMAAKVGQKLLATGVSADDWRKIFTVGGKWIGLLLGVGVVLLASRLAKRRKAKAAG